MIRVSVIAGTFVVMTAAAAFYITHYYGNVPYADEWNYVPWLVGAEPVTPRFLWEQHNEHRYPLARLAYLGLCRATNTLWVGSYVTVAGMALLALAMCRVAARLRGYASWTDAFFPILFLHFGHYENYLMAWQIVFTLAAALGGAAFLLVLQFRAGTSATFFLFAGILLLLPLNGALGLPYALALALWFGLAAFATSGSPLAWRAGRSVLSLGACAATVMLVGLYFVGYESEGTSSPTRPTAGKMLRTAVEFLSNVLGPVHGPGDDRVEVWQFLVVPVLAAGLSAAGFCLAALRRPEERQRALGLLFFQGTVVVLALALGKGRAEYGGFVSRYVILAAPALYATYFAWLLYGPARVGPLLQAALCLLVAVATTVNVREARTFGESRRQLDQAFLSDLRDGRPVHYLARHYTRAYTGVLDQESFIGYLGQLRDSPYRPYQALQDLPAFAEVPVPVSPSSTFGVKRQGRRWHASSVEAYLEYALSPPRAVEGIYVVLRYQEPEIAQIPFRMAWKENEEPELQNPPAGDRWEARQLDGEKQEHAVTVWIAEDIDRFRIYPGLIGGQVTVVRITLLVADGSPSVPR
jgi:hypothetical protein